MPVRLEPAAPRPQVKHSTTEPLRSLKKQVPLLHNTVLILCNEEAGLMAVIKFFLRQGSYKSPPLCLAKHKANGHHIPAKLLKYLI